MTTTEPMTPVAETPVLGLVAEVVDEGGFRFQAVAGGEVLHEAAFHPDEPDALAAFVAAAIAAAEGAGVPASGPALAREVARVPDEIAAAAVDAEYAEKDEEVDTQNAFRLARVLLKRHHDHHEDPTLAHWQGQFYRWDGRRWAEAPDLPGRIPAAIESEFARANRAAIRAWGAEPVGSRKPRPPAARNVDAKVINNVVKALASVVLVGAEHGDPAWIGSYARFEATHPARDFLAFPNALIHWPTYAAEGGDPVDVGPRPGYFSTRCLPYDFDPAAPPPTRWLAFLHQLWGDDRESVAALQEWFGYCLTPGTKLQRMLMLQGVKRSGKGTIARVLTALLGAENVAGPTLDTLADKFGLQELIGKSLAIVGDARNSARIDQGVLVARLLSITGEDRLDVPRKNLRAWQGTLPTRLMILANESPQLRDAAGALASRLLILRLTRDFSGREDRDLTPNLMEELPGILLWAIQGRRQLDERGEFRQPASALGLLEEFQAIASSIGGFVKECCVVGPEHSVKVDTLYDQFCRFRKRQGEEFTPRKEVFGSDLRAVVPDLERRQGAAEGGSRPYWYHGIGLISHRG